MNTPRNIYFVRHAQTDANVSGYAQTNDSQLTDTGIKQAQVLSERFSDVNVDVVLTSEFSRTINTANIVVKGKKVKSLQTSLLNERLKPASVFGLQYSHPKYQDFFANFLCKASDTDYRYEDGENIHDIVQRIKKILQYIEDDTQGDVLVVTHGIILRLLVGYILTRSDDMEVYVSVFRNIKFDNTGITHVKLFTDGTWQFGTINDSTHLS